MEFFLLLILFHKELSSSFWLVDNFSDCFSFYTVNCKDKKIKDIYIYNLNKVFKDSLSDSKKFIVISDTSIKNNIAMWISYVCMGHKILAKTIHHAINVTLTEVELFAIRCEINQAV